MATDDSKCRVVGSLFLAELLGELARYDLDRTLDRALAEIGRPALSAIQPVAA